jgi:hypothetical protein
MPSEAPLNLSFLQLLQAFNEQLTVGGTRIQETPLPKGAASVTALKTEVRTPQSIRLS